MSESCLKYILTAWQVKIITKFHYQKHGKHAMLTKALQNWKISVKALAKQLWKLTIKTKRLSRLKLLSFVNVND